MKSILDEREDDIGPERLFFNSIKSPATKRAYPVYLQKFMEYVNCKTVNGLIRDFKDIDSKDIERRLIEFIIQLKEDEGMNFRSIYNYIGPVISFYNINNFILKSRRLMRFMPPKNPY